MFSFPQNPAAAGVFSGEKDRRLQIKSARPSKGRAHITRDTTFLSRVRPTLTKIPTYFLPLMRAHSPDTWKPLRVTFPLSLSDPFAGRLSAELSARSTLCRRLFRFDFRLNGLAYEIVVIVAPTFAFVKYYFLVFRKYLPRPDHPSGKSKTQGLPFFFAASPALVLVLFLRVVHFEGVAGRERFFAVLPANAQAGVFLLRAHKHG